MDYEQLLSRVKKKIERAELVSRFELPTIDSVCEGNKTIIKNFMHISRELRRKPDHLFRFFLHELAVPGSLDKRATFIGKFSEKQLQEKLRSYVDRYVICRVCRKPDTLLVVEKKKLKLLCEACGALHRIG
jgi:translation initiation factor 2 subunit 2